MPYEYKQFHRRKLPHRHSPGATLFVTFRLAGSIPKSVLAIWKAEKELLENKFLRVKSQTHPERDEAVLNFHRSWFRHFEEVLD